MQFNITVFGYEVGVSIEREQETVFDPEIPALVECDQCGEVHFEDADC